ncbi:DUF1801 domain-containing protein [candidate division KSB1 bacterium]|nr:DUF1801 domain-containing protein [candidate division KSB1 bacterium]
MKSNASTVEQYLSQLDRERRPALQAVRQVILDNLDSEFEEVINRGMICYQVPLQRYSDNCNGKPLMYAALASQKHHMAVYLTAVYIGEEKQREFKREYLATGKRYDAGKSCVRFRKLDDLPLPLIAKVIGMFSVDAFIERMKRLSWHKTEKGGCKIAIER